MEFRKTDSLDAGVQSMNAIEAQKLYPLLERAVERLHLEEDVLTSEEMEQFTERFGLDLGQATKVIRFCTFIFSKALEAQPTEEDLALGLRGAGASEQHCMAFATAWKRKKEGLLKRVKKKAFGAPATLEAVDWRVHLQVKGSGEGAEEVCPKAVFQLDLRDQSTDVGAKSLNIEFDREELERLYNNFEEIQSQLDALT